MSSRLLLEHEVRRTGEFGKRRSWTIYVSRTSEQKSAECGSMPSATFRFSFRFIFTSEKSCSVQVHPDDEVCPHGSECTRQNRDVAYPFGEARLDHFRSDSSNLLAEAATPGGNREAKRVEQSSQSDPRSSPARPTSPEPGRSARSAHGILPIVRDPAKLGRHLSPLWLLGRAGGRVNPASRKRTRSLEHRSIRLERADYPP